MNCYKRIISFLMAFSIVLTFSLATTYADDYVNTPQSYWQTQLHRAANLDLGFFTLGRVIGIYSGHVCELSSDGFHHADSIAGCELGSDSHGEFALATCKFCNQKFHVYASDLSAAYNDYVDELPLTGIDNEGGFLWYPTFADFKKEWGTRLHYALSNGASFDYNTDGTIAYSLNGRNVEFSPLDDRTVRVTSSDLNGALSAAYYSFGVPVNGNYKRIVSTSFSGVADDKYSLIYQYSERDHGALNKGSVISDSGLSMGGGGGSFCVGEIYLPVFEVIPATGFDSTSYTDNSRPASITGDYGIINQDGSVSVVESQTIVNETDKSVYNPVTNTTTTYDGWQYDYSTRTYTLTKEGDSSTTTTVTYGDESMTIVEGDTVYNVYYYVEPQGNGGGNGGGSTDPAHQHNYTCEITQDPSCVAKGSKTFTCSECGNSYTEAISALGHDWHVKTQVQTKYDENGELTSQGYTIYKCSRCGEEYKSEDGKPPSSGADDDGSGGIGGKLGELFGTIFGGLLGGVGKIIEKLLDALIALGEMIGEKLLTVIDLILGFFDTIPQLFTGFLEFLGAMFSFLPEEMMMLLTFGLACVMFIGIIKAIRRR